jgi:hypothetical protein
MLPVGENDMRQRFSWKREWTLILILFLFFRSLYTLLGVFEASGPAPEPLSSGPVFEAAATLLKPGTISHALVNVWFRWDTIWYLKIAAFGYSPQDGTFAYMPLYPWLVRGLGVLTNNYLLAALIISNLACLSALLLFHEIALGEGKDKRAALEATLFLVLFPTSFFLFAAYTDSLFLALALAAWLAARRGNWLAAGVLAALATLCRLQGALLSIVLLWAYLDAQGIKKLFQFLPKLPASKSLIGNRQTDAGEAPGKGNSGFFVTLRDFSGRMLKKPDWLATLLPGLTFAAYSLWMRAAGSGSIPVTLETHWGVRTVAPWTGFGLFLQRLVGRPRVFVDYVDLALFGVMVILLVVGLFRLNPALSIYGFLTFSLFFMRGTPPHLLDSFSRYFLTLFPAFIILGQLTGKLAGSLPGRIARVFLLSASIGLQIFLVMGFLDWRWIA